MDKAPRYDWSCHACDKGNAAGEASCVHCGFPCNATPMQVAEARGEPPPHVPGRKSYPWPLDVLLGAFVFWS